MTQPSFFQHIKFLFSFGVISVLFGLMFKILPDAKIKWKHVWLGSIVTGILFTIGKTLLAFYFSIANPASVYGLQARHFSPVVGFLLFDDSFL
jgi:membrane protein